MKKSGLVTERSVNGGRRKSLHAFKGLSRMPAGNHARSAAAKSSGYNSLGVYQPNAIWQWIVSYLKYAFCPKHRFLNESAAPNKQSVYQVPNNLKVSLAGDWGTGTEEAAAVATQMKTWPSGEPVDLTIHLGDVYYVGDEPELRENCLGASHGEITGVTWPHGRLGSFGLNGNHEMYANGNAYFDIFLPTLGMHDSAGKPLQQGPSFFCLENDHWRILGLDTGYNSVGFPIISLWMEGNCRLPHPLIKWLRETVKPKEKPKATILLSHHQYFSGFEKNYPEPARQLAEFFESPVIWLWGHEHRLAGYQYFGTDSLKVHGRCIGTGGMPIEAKAPPATNALAQQLLFYDARINPRYGEQQLGFNGHAQLEFVGNRFTITYYSLGLGADETYAAAAQPLLREVFECHGAHITHAEVQKLSQDPKFVTFAVTGP